MSSRNLLIHYIFIGDVYSKTELIEIEINAYKDDGSVDEGKTEKINMLGFDVETLTVIEDASGLNYYVTK